MYKISTLFLGVLFVLISFLSSGQCDLDLTQYIKDGNVLNQQSVNFNYHSDYIFEYNITLKKGVTYEIGFVGDALNSVSYSIEVVNKYETTNQRVEDELIEYQFNEPKFITLKYDAHVMLKVMLTDTNKEATETCIGFLIQEKRNVTK